MVPLEFSEYNVTWVASKLLGAAGALRAEAIELINWLLHFGCTSKNFKVISADLADWMTNSSSPWAAYHDMMAYCLIALDKHPGVCHGGMGETL